MIRSIINMGATPLSLAGPSATIAAALALPLLIACGGGDSDAPRATGGTAVSIVLPTAKPAVATRPPSSLTPATVAATAYSLILEAFEFEDEFVFAGELLGGPDSHPDYYCQPIAWDFGDGNVITASPGCVQYTEAALVPRDFIETYVYDQPGAYEVTLRYGDLISNTVTVTIPEPPAATPNPRLPGEGEPLAGSPELVWPSIIQLNPRAAAPGEDVQVTGNGGFLFTPPNFYNESAREFPLYLDGEEIAVLSCYGGACLGVVPLPDDIEPGEHVVSVDGGSRATITVQ